MANPWLKKNPFLSMWLSGANAAVGHARGHASAAARRQAANAVTQGADDIIRAWTATLATPSSKTRKRRKR